MGLGVRFGNSNPTASQAALASPYGEFKVGELASNQGDLKGEKPAESPGETRGVFGTVGNPLGAVENDAPEGCCSVVVAAAVAAEAVAVAGAPPGAGGHTLALGFLLAIGELWGVGIARATSFIGRVKSSM